MFRGLDVTTLRMALAITITLDKPLPDAQAAYVKAGQGKSLAREFERIDSAARLAKVAAPTSMLSENPAALAAQLKAEGFDPAKMRLPAEQWFPAADGLKVVKGLIVHVNASLNDFKQPHAILRDLKSAEALLTAAVAAEARFHFTKTDL
jgi:hypothetical protein